MVACLNQAPSLEARVTAQPARQQVLEVLEVLAAL